MNYFSILLVLIAGAAWAGTGLAAQDFFSKSSLSPMDLTVFRMACTGILMSLLTVIERKLEKNIKAVKREPKLVLAIIIYGIGGLLAMHYTYFASIAAGNAAAVWRTVAGRKRARRMIAARSRIRRRAVAFRGGVWYNSHRCAAMGGEMPATERDNGTMKTFPRPVNGLPRPVAHFTRLRGAGFCK